MNLSDLLKKRLIEQFKSDTEQVRKEMEIARRDISAAKKMLQIEEWGWAHNAAYNAMLQSARALMFHKGYRPMSQDHHVAVISFMEVVYSAKFGGELIQRSQNRSMPPSHSLYGFRTRKQIQS